MQTDATFIPKLAQIGKSTDLELCRANEKQETNNSYAMN